MNKNQGFTLIELLVVVLIIGILSSIALPQYQKAVQKSRNTQLKTLVRSIAQAQMAYYLANGELAGDFGSLDLDLPLSAPEVEAGTGNTCHLITLGADSIREGNDFQIVLNNNSTSNGGVAGVWTTGKYKCTGFSVGSIGSGGFTMRCTEKNSAEIEAGEFCEKLENAPFSANGNGWRHYALP